MAADTRHLRERLHALAAGLEVADPGALAEQVLLIYDGSLAAYLRGGAEDSVTRGRALAAVAVAAAKECVSGPRDGRPRGG